MFLLLGVKKEAQKEKGQKGTTQANPLKHGIACQGYVSPQKAKGYAHPPQSAGSAVASGAEEEPSLRAGNCGVRRETTPGFGFRV